MKLKLIPLLLTGLLLTGCAKDIPEINISDTSSQSQLESTEAVETSSQGDNAGEDTEEEETAQEAYTLTFEANTIEGEALTSECFSQSKLTMLNVWATYCNPCLSEMPDLGEIAASYDLADFQMIGIISDVIEDDDEANIENAKELIAQTNADYPHLLLNQSLFSNLVGAVDSVPTTFFVNQKGEVMGYVVGAQSKEVWEGIINDFLEQNQ